MFWVIVFVFVFGCGIWLIVSLWFDIVVLVVLAVAEYPIQARASK